MVRIRLKRVGKKKQPSYRVVVADSRSPRDGRIIETLGHYNPLRNPSEVVIDSERAVYWLRRGAQPTDSVRNLLRICGAWAEFTGEKPPAPPTPEEKRARATVASGEEEPAEPRDAEEAQAQPEAPREGGPGAGEDPGEER